MINRFIGAMGKCSLSLYCNSLFSNSLFSKRIKAFNILSIVVLFSLVACSSDDGGPVRPEPTLTVIMAVDPNTPLAGLLIFTTQDPTRISIDISDGPNTRTIDYDGYNTSHDLTIVGFRPGRINYLNIRAYNEAEEAVSVEQAHPVTVPALPVGFPTITVSSNPSMMEPGYTLFNLLPQQDSDISTQTDTEALGPAIVIVDNVGDVVWYHRGPRFFDVRQLANGNILFMEGYKIVEMDMLGNRLKEWSDLVDPVSKVRVTEANRFHHDIFPMNNGNFLTLSVEARLDVANYPTSLDPTVTTTETVSVAGDVIVEFDSNGEVVKQWHLLDMLNIYRLGYGSLGSYWSGTFGSQSRDWSHANAVVYDSTDDSIIVSIRHQDAILKFSRATGNIIWILSPTDENWTAPHDQFLLTPTNPQTDFYTYHQHAPMVLDNGNILIYDNGSFRANPINSYPVNPQTFSRAVEYSINENTMDATLVWEYGDKTEGNPGWNYSGALGDADLLPDTGNVLITHGSMFNSLGKQWTRIVEVTHTIGNSAAETEVFEMIIEGSTDYSANGWRVYRSERIKNF